MLRKASAAESIVSVDVPTPTRERSIRHGAYANNILRLEQSAEKMSEGGSDIGEEIRKMNEAERERSRQNSIQSSNQDEYIPGHTAPLEASRSRASSHAQSIVDVNGTARWGGYSPGGYITSPVGSVRSHGSWGQQPSMNRKPSTSSRLAQMVEPVQEGRPLDSPLAPSTASYFPGQSVSRHASQASRASHASRTSENSFAKRYDQIAGEIHDRLENVPPTPPRHESPSRNAEYDEERDGEQRAGTATPPHRPRSSDTYQEAQIAFKDFDGVHFSPSTEEFVEIDEDGNEVRRVSARNSSGNLSSMAASMLRTPRARPISYAQPPPGDDMVYYPAPVPRMLNLPKRLSQLPSASVQAKRRTQVLGQLQPDARHSAAWLSQTNFDASGHRRSGSGSQPDSHPQRGALNERMSMANFQNLPPQLRASVFFEHQSLSQSVEIAESAVATLDNILAASVTAPVSAFTDHPYAGDVRKSVYAPEKIAQRRSTATLVQRATNVESPPEADERAKMRRRSSLGMLLRRNSSGDELGAVLKRNESRSSILLDFNEGGKKLQKRKSQMSLGDELERPENVALPPTPGEEREFEHGLLGGGRVTSGSRPTTAISGRAATVKGGKVLTEAEAIAQDFAEAEELEDVYDPDGDVSFVQPSTLLAELQVRKAQLKSRNRTAVTAYPNGMHSTLLELDAVAGIEQRKRQRQRIALAWEDPGSRQDQANKDEEDDVPLGVLFPSKNGLVNRAMGDERDWNRPLGLMEKRQLEDEEPLSSRRNRLRGGPALARQKPGTLLNNSQMHLAGQPDAPPEGEVEDSEHEGETLGQRLRRLRTKNELDIAISDLAPKDGERPISTFSAEVLSQFNGLDKDAAAGADIAEPARGAPTPEALEGETLGARRARLQREREANGGNRIVSDPTAAVETATRPAIRSTNSMANLLTTNPVSASRRASAMQVPAQGTLLATSAEQQAKSKNQLRDTNLRGMSYGIGQPMPTSTTQQRPTAYRAASSSVGLLGQQPAGTAYTGGFAGGTFNNGLGGAGMQTSASTPMFGMQPTNSYFASPTAMQMQIGGYGPQAGMGGYQQQVQMPGMYGGLGGAYGYPTQFGGMSGAYGGMGMGTGYNGMGYGGGIGTGMGYGGMGMGMVEQDMTPQQRATIDSWRQSVAH